ncbi:hypothetical protein, partial [Modestobacter roseus]|uniref:hypothetical protein n=1 Tax=Modestobacter roseus TaxID=1181884 RepID=UPI0034DE2B4F
RRPAGSRAHLPAPSTRPPLRLVAAAAPGAVTGPRCGCGHGREAHRHHRRGSDCGLCTCAQFAGRLARLTGRG